MDMFSVDGLGWDVICEITRITEVKASEISGWLQNMDYFNDVLGTLLRYEIGIIVPYGRESDYSALYETLSDPVASHTFVLPYNSGTIQITARVEQISDIYERLASGQSYWRGIKFTAIATAPHKEEELGEVIARGVGPVPILPWTGYVRFYVDANGDLHVVKSRYAEVNFYIDDEGVLHSFAPGDFLEYTSYGWNRISATDAENNYY